MELTYTDFTFPPSSALWISTIVFKGGIDSCFYEYHFECVCLFSVWFRVPQPLMIPSWLAWVSEDLELCSAIDILSLYLWLKFLLRYKFWEQSFRNLSNKTKHKKKPRIWWLYLSQESISQLFHGPHISTTVRAVACFRCRLSWIL